MIEGNPVVSIIMGSGSDWPTLEHAANCLGEFDVAYETRIVSAHRTPDRLFQFAKSAAQRGIKIIIAGAGGSAHLPGMAAALCELPVIAVPVQSKSLSGVDSLLSMVQMPKGVAVATQAIGPPGAFNAGIMAVQMLAISDEVLARRFSQWRADQTLSIPEEV